MSLEIWLTDFLGSMLLEYRKKKRLQKKSAVSKQILYLIIYRQFKFQMNSKYIQNL